MFMGSGKARRLLYLTRRSLASYVPLSTQKHNRLRMRQTQKSNFKPLTLFTVVCAFVATLLALAAHISEHDSQQIVVYG
jgi:hypothetical protein